MNGAYYPNPTFPNNMNNYNQESDNFPAIQSQEQSYIENILRLNKNKKAKLFASYPDSNQWRDRIHDGIIEQAVKDHVIMSSPSLGDWYLIPLIYVNWVEFEEPINYSPNL